MLLLPRRVIFLGVVLGQITFRVEESFSLLAPEEQRQKNSSPELKMKDKNLTPKNDGCEKATRNGDQGLAIFVSIHKEQTTLAEGLSISIPE